MLSSTLDFQSDFQLFWKMLKKRSQGPSPLLRPASQGGWDTGLAGTVSEGNIKLSQALSPSLLPPTLPLLPEGRPLGLSGSEIHALV